MMIENEFRSGACADQVSELMGWAVGAKYVEKAFNDSAKLEVNYAFYEIKYILYVKVSL